MTIVPQQEVERLEFANTLRGLAALSVIVTHYIGFWYGRDVVSRAINAPELPADVQTPGFIDNINWILLHTHVNFGSFGVGLFFLISGFVIPFSLSRVTALQFGIRRFFRIIPTYVVAFSITLLAIWSSGAHFGRDIPFGMNDILVHYLPGARDLVGTRNIDGIIWTLEIEMKFYVLMGCCAALVRRKSLFVFLAPAAIALISVALDLSRPLLLNMGLQAHIIGSAIEFFSPYLVFMFVGVSFYYFLIGKLYLPLAATLVAALCVTSWILFRIGPYPRLVAQAPSFAGAILIFGGSFVLRRMFRPNPVSAFFADVSYPLYAIHAYAGWALLRLLLDRGVAPSLSIIIVVVCALSLAWGLHVAVEVPTNGLGALLVTGRAPSESGPQKRTRGARQAAALVARLLYFQIKGERRKANSSSPEKVIE